MIIVKAAQPSRTGFASKGCGSTFNLDALRQNNDRENEGLTLATTQS